MKAKFFSLIKEKGAYFLTEYIIVVVGILSAFGLNAWWESKKAQQRESAYFSQIQIEIDQADQEFGRFIETLANNLGAVQHVYECLSEGELVGEYVELFDQGLLGADVLPAMRYPVPTYRESRSTGVFTELSDDSLKGILSDLHMEFEFAVAQLAYYRVGLQSAKAELNRSVVFSVRAPEDGSSDWFSVSYDFEELADNERLRNEFVEVVDSHFDWLSTVERLHSLIKSYREASERNEV